MEEGRERRVEGQGVRRARGLAEGRGEAAAGGRGDGKERMSVGRGGDGSMWLVQVRREGERMVTPSGVMSVSLMSGM